VEVVLIVLPLTLVTARGMRRARRRIGIGGDVGLARHVADRVVGEDLGGSNIGAQRRARQAIERVIDMSSTGHTRGSPAQAATMSASLSILLQKSFCTAAQKF
jgi:hypothetical protein